ncbi:glycosyltransferase [Demequina sp. SO4-13]|uniref:glycosyltransferase n=1 Tax=Demequina sp. SO4-13 TaxID=3401027 RepID=UPI003AF862F8
MTNDRFTLLLPFYKGDRAEFLRDAFRTSVDEQTRPPNEVVLVRDGPVGADLDDAVADIGRTASVPLRRIELDDNDGLANALTVGLDASAHDIVARMDADDLSFPERFARQLDLLSQGLDLVGSGLVEFHGDLRQTMRERVPPAGGAIRDYARFRSPFNHPTVVYRRAAVRAAGGYLPMGQMEDYWLWVRMLDAGTRADNITEPLLGYRVDSGAYARRGGVRQLEAEIRLQRGMRRLGFTSRRQFVRNVAIRGTYRLVPTGLRRRSYQLLTRRASPTGGA